jgi:hypothetical protein
MQRIVPHLYGKQKDRFGVDQNGPRITRIERVFTDPIRINAFAPRYPRPIEISPFSILHRYRSAPPVVPFPFFLSARIRLYNPRFASQD